MSQGTKSEIFSKLVNYLLSYEHILRTFRVEIEPNLSFERPQFERNFQDNLINKAKLIIHQNFEQ